jgi:hypothetical protein
MTFPAGVRQKASARVLASTELNAASTELDLKT